MKDKWYKSKGGWIGALFGLILAIELQIELVKYKGTMATTIFDISFIGINNIGFFAPFGYIVLGFLIGYFIEKRFS